MESSCGQSTRTQYEYKSSMEVGGEIGAGCIECRRAQAFPGCSPSRACCSCPAAASPRPSSTPVSRSRSGTGPSPRTGWTTSRPASAPRSRTRSPPRARPCPCTSSSGASSASSPLQSAVEQMAQDFDVRPGNDYYTQVAQIEADAEGLSEDGRDDYVEVQATLPYITDVLTQIGLLLLEAGGRGRADRRLPAGPRAGRAGGVGGARRGHLRPALPDRAGRGPARSRSTPTCRSRWATSPRPGCPTATRTPTTSPALPLSATCG